MSKLNLDALKELYVAKNISEIFDKTKETFRFIFEKLNPSEIIVEKKGNWVTITYPEKEELNEKMRFADYYKMYLGLLGKFSKHAHLTDVEESIVSIIRIENPEFKLKEEPVKTGKPKEETVQKETKPIKEVEPEEALNPEAKPKVEPTSSEEEFPLSREEAIDMILNHVEASEDVKTVCTLTVSAFQESVFALIPEDVMPEILIVVENQELKEKAEKFLNTLPLSKELVISVFVVETEEGAQERINKMTRVSELMNKTQDEIEKKAYTKTLLVLGKDNISSILYKSWVQNEESVAVLSSRDLSVEPQVKKQEVGEKISEALKDSVVKEEASAENSETEFEEKPEEKVESAEKVLAESKSQVKNEAIATAPVKEESVMARFVSHKDDFHELAPNVKSAYDKLYDCDISIRFASKTNQVKIEFAKDGSDNQIFEWDDFMEFTKNTYAQYEDAYMVTEDDIEKFNELAKELQDFYEKAGKGIISLYLLESGEIDVKGSEILTFIPSIDHLEKMVEDFRNINKEPVQSEQEEVVETDNYNESLSANNVGLFYKFNDDEEKVFQSFEEVNDGFSLTLKLEQGGSIVFEGTGGQRFELMLRKR